MAKREYELGSRPAISKKATQHDRDFAARLRRMRILAGLTMAQLAARAGVSYRIMHRYETGQTRVTVGRAVLFADALCVPVEALIVPERPKARGGPDRALLAITRRWSALDDDRRAALSRVSEALATPCAECRP